MRKLLVILFTFLCSVSYSQNAIKLEGTWTNHQGEVLKMGWKVWQRQTTKGLIQGTWEEIDEKTLKITRSTGEEYSIKFSVVGTTWVIERPFSDEAWLWHKIN